MWEDYIKGLEEQLLSKYEVPKINGNYSAITDTQYLELLAISSGLFSCTFAFERNIVEVKEKILKPLINYNDVQGIAKKDINDLFKL